MKLIEVVGALASFDNENTIYASQPWTADSEAVVESSPESNMPPTFVEQSKMKYFLEVFIARDFLDDWATNLEKAPTLEQKCARLIQYAINDA